MSEWRPEKLGNIIEIIGGGTPKTSCEKYWNGNIPWLSVVDFNKGRKYVEETEKTITQEGLVNSSTKLLAVGDIIISARGTVGVLAILKKIMAFNQSCYGVRGKKNISYSNWIYYQLKNVVRELTQISHGGVFDTITRSTFDEIEIGLPPITEQKAIASVLSSLDDKIDLLHRQNKTLESMAETLFRQWFVENIDDSAGSITLGEMINIHDSKRIPLSKLERDKKKNNTALYPYYGAAKIMDYIDEYIFDGDYLLLGEDGTVQDSNGNPILQRANGKFWVNNHAHVLTAKKPFSNFFLWCLLSKTNIERAITGAVQPKINQENLKKLDFVKFEENKVNEFNQVTDSLLSKLNTNLNKIQTLEKLRDTLLPKLMSGEVRVQYTKE